MMLKVIVCIGVIVLLAGCSDSSAKVILRDVNTSQIIQDVNGVSDLSFKTYFDSNLAAAVPWGDVNVADALTVSGAGSVTWAALTTYPSACPAGQAVTAVGDTLTCAVVASSNDLNWASLSSKIPWVDANVADTLTVDGSSTVTWAALSAYPSSCPAGQAVTAVGDTLTCATVAGSSSTSGTGGYIDYFKSTDLSSGVLSVNHDLNTTAIGAHIYNDLNKEITPDEITIIDVDTIEVDLGTYTVNNWWSVSVVAANSNNDDIGNVTSFDNGDLVSGVLTVTHNNGDTYMNIEVVNENNEAVTPDKVIFDSNIQLRIDVHSYAPITGTWRVVIDARQ